MYDFFFGQLTWYSVVRELGYQDSPPLTAGNLFKQPESDWICYKKLSFFDILRSMVTMDKVYLFSFIAWSYLNGLDVCIIYICKVLIIIIFLIV